MSSEKEDSIPAEKLREMEKGKIEFNSKKPKNTEKTQRKPNKGIFIYLLTSELVILSLVIVFFSLVLVTPSLFFSISPGGTNLLYYRLEEWTYILIFPIPSLSLINSYVYIFGLSPKDRYKIYIVRFVSIIALIALSFPLWDPVGVNYYERENIIWLFLFILYAFISQTILKTYLLSSEKPTSETLFKKAIEGSPSELEWRKYDNFSGYFGIIAGALLLQVFWLGYHVIIRPIKVRNKKRKLVLENLKFHEEVNLTPIALDLGMPLEEVIFILKQLSLRRQITVDFSRYGAILKDIRRVKWFTPVVQEKLLAYLHQKEQTDAEIKAQKFIELSERRTMLLADFRRALGLGDSISVRELILFLPHKVLSYRETIFNKKKIVVFHRNQILMKRERIIKAFVENREKLFSK